MGSHIIVAPELNKKKPTTGTVNFFTPFFNDLGSHIIVAPELKRKKKKKKLVRRTKITQKKSDVNI